MLRQRIDAAPRSPPLRFARSPRRLGFLALLFAIALVAALDLAFPPPLPDALRDGSTLVLARDGTPLRAFANAAGTWRYPVAPEAVSPLYLEALLGYEDRWFEYHLGVNPLALARAAWQALRNGRIVSGGSTLTMQVARLLEPTPRSGMGKLRQMVRALQLERRLSKREILALYLAYAPFGGNVQGVEAASWAYLGKSAAQLSRAEAALLAVLPQAPSRLRPDRHAAAARAARDKVIARLGVLGIWSRGALAEAQLEPVVARRLVAPLRAALLAQRLADAQPDARLIRTTIDASLQGAVERRVSSWLSPLPPKTSAAVLLVENATREVRAYVGSARFADAQRLGHVDMVTATRSPGSTLKPFLYGLALDDGLIHSESLLVDAPQDFDGYRPANFGDHFNGPVSAAESLRLSLNVPAVELLARITPRRFASRLRHGGIALQLPRGAEPNLSMILGGTGTSLEQLVAGYTGLARGGVAGSLRYTETQAHADRVLLSAGAAYIVRSVLEAHPRPGDAIQGLDLSARRRLAWKTGTSYGYRDTWAIGVTPGYTIGVWIGRPDGTPLPGHFGAITAAPLLFALVDTLPRHPHDRDVPAMPADVRLAEICWPLGRESAGTDPALCHEARDALVLADVVPPTLPPLGSPDRSSLLTSWLRETASGDRVLASCARGAYESVALARWPALAQPWLSAVERASGSPPPLAAHCRGEGTTPSSGLEIAGLNDGDTYAPAPGSSHSPVLDLRALGAEGAVDWLLDGRLVGTSRGNDVLPLKLDQPGAKVLVAIDRAGRYDRVAFRISR